MTKIPKLYINPGHSDRDPGAVGYETERELNVKVSNYQRDHLLANYIVEIRMNPGTVDSLSAIANDANDWGADLFVSNHFNAGGGDGWEGFVYSEKTVPLGELFAKRVEAIGQNLRPYGAAPGVKIRPGLAVLKRTHMPAILTEGAFVDNKKDIEDWNDDHELKRLGEAYAEASAEFLKLERKTQAAPEPTPEPVLVSNSYRVQVGAFSKKAYAERKMEAVRAAGFDAYVTNADDKLWRVQVGSFSEKSDAEQMRAQLMQAGFSGYVTKVAGAPMATPTKKSIDELAREVIQGKHGNGEDRRKSLGELYDAVQKRVNELLK